MKPVGEATIRRSEWINVWDSIFRRGVPEDLLNPYGRFDIILNKLLEAGTKKVLDVAMGVGRHAAILANSGLEVYGFDLSDSALSLAKKELGRRNLRCQMVKEDMFNSYPYRDNFFDGVVAIQAIYHGYKNHMVKALSEIHRVLKKGGLLAFTVSTDKKRSALGSKSKEIIKIATNTYMAASGREKGIPHYYPTPDEVVTILKPKFGNISIIVDDRNKYLLIVCSAR